MSLRRWQQLLLIVLVCATAMLILTWKRSRYYLEDAHHSTMVDSPGRFSNMTNKYPDPNPDAPWPRIAWLMSFPNSGTSYTLVLLNQVSNRTLASNYGQECEMDRNGRSIPVHPDSPFGPFYRDTTGKSPDKYIITKSHCGGRCPECGPSKYLETRRSFLISCASGSRMVPSINATGSVREKVHYDPIQMVHRAIHLIRDPFDNIVSQFHHLQKERPLVWRDRYPNNQEGFQKWCREVDSVFWPEERNSRLIDDDVLQAFVDVPCHGEFYRYMQWHNLAFDVTRRMEIPTLTIHYEHYADKFDKQLSDMLSFLQLPSVAGAYEFQSGKNYDSYYSDNDRTAAWKLMKLLVTSEAWDAIKEYETK
eukprot:scaffold21463_cov52-Attheya_sp.AAC.4